MSVQKEFIDLLLFIPKYVWKHCDCTQVCVPQMLWGRGCNVAQEPVQTLLIYTCERCGLPAAELLLFFAEADPKMMVLMLVLFSLSSEECSTWPLTKDFCKSGPSCTNTTGQFPVNLEKKNPHITTLSLVKAFTNSFQDTMKMVRSNFCSWKTQGRDLNLVLLLPDPGYHSLSVGGSPETHKPPPIPTQKLMSAGWNWPHSGCGHGTDTKKADSAHSQIIFTVFPCWNLWEG